MNRTIDVTWTHDDDIALALSGGVDSVVLYHLLTNEYKHTYNNLLVLHVNHGVRSESAVEAEYIKNITARDGVAFEMLTLDFKGEFSQAAARTKRYAFFKREMNSHKTKYLLTAHHLDDQYETILQQILTGRHLFGNLGIPESVKADGITTVRPLHKIKKSAIERYQQDKNLKFFEDASNSEDDYTRNYVRHHLVPPIKNRESLDIDHLLNVREDMNNLSEFASDYAENFIVKYQYKIPRKQYLEQNKTLRRYILTKLLASAGARASRHALNTMDIMIHSDLAQSTYDIDGATLHIEYEVFYALPKKEFEASPTLSIERSGEYHYNGYKIVVSADSSVYPLTVRTKNNGDKIRINNVGTKKVSRLFIDKKVPNSTRMKIPVVVNSKGIIIAVGTIYNIIEPSKNRLLKITKEYCDDDSE